MLVRSVSLSPDLANDFGPRPTKTLLSSHPLAPGPSTPGQEEMFHWSLKLDSLQVDSALTISIGLHPADCGPIPKAGETGELFREYEHVRPRVKRAGLLPDHNCWSESIGGEFTHV
jgi:hypothetical protein